MALRVTFDLEERDLDYFRTVIKRAQEKSAQRAGAPETDEDVCARAERVVRTVRDSAAPSFVIQRIERVASLIDMLGDAEWALPAPERRNVLSALTYFADPEDIIPDSVPVLGYIDDAIMIELIVKDLKPEIDAFEDFRRYRREEASRNRRPNVTRAEWLEAKRRELHQRMRRRHRSRSSSRGGTRVKLF